MVVTPGFYTTKRWFVIEAGGVVKSVFSHAKIQRITANPVAHCLTAVSTWKGNKFSGTDVSDVMNYWY